MVMVAKTQGQQAYLDWSEFLRTFSYKPGWKFKLGTNIDWDMEQLSITMLVPNSREDGSMRKMIPVGIDRFVQPFDYYGGREKAIEYLRELIRELEFHEIDEWFRVDGELLFDPHADEPIPKFLETFKDDNG